MIKEKEVDLEKKEEDGKEEEINYTISEDAGFSDTEKNLDKRIQNVLKGF